MKKTLVLLIVGMLLTAGNAFAFWTGDIENPVDPSTYYNVLTLDWSSSGSGLAVDFGAPGTVPVPGQEFDFLYQAVLTGLTGPTGNEIATPNLNITHEYTFVAVVPEVVVFTAPAPFFTTYFNTDATLPAGSLGNKWAIYYDGIGVGGVQADVPSGTGFNDGWQIATGYWVPAPIYTTLYSPSGIPIGSSGIGSFILEGIVDWFDTSFFGPDVVTGQSIFDIRFEGTTNFPPLDSTTVSFFDGNDGYNIFNTIGSDDILFKVDASNKFSVVPEPSTFILLGGGLLGLVGLGAARRKRS